MEGQTKLTIEPAYDSLDEILELFGEYTAMLGIDLSFQNYEQERVSLPGKYAPPNGRLYLARSNGAPAGCVALRPWKESIEEPSAESRQTKPRQASTEDSPSTCEMKRLYVRPAFRGLKLGRLLIEKVIRESREIGYSRILLDTFARLEVSLALYKKLGFHEIAPYYHNPYPGVVYLSLNL
ncbi:MAG: GNAT family N-acetyltransferase [Synergistaceae bacterium]|jgi:ribosomal protein S18 acetylase RimI-like enzyme|nr:GNAT family N-acetyltransferase [Synergistaceae bacterium]